MKILHSRETPISEWIARVSRDDLFNKIHASAGGYLNQDLKFATYGYIPTNTTSSPSASGLSHTDVLQRGLLPFATEDQRVATRDYHGNALVMSSDAACLRPVATDLTYISINSTTSGTLRSGGAISGRFRYDISLKNAQIDAKDYCRSKNCSVSVSCIPASPSDADTGPQSSICFLDSTAELRANAGQVWNPDQGLWTNSSIVGLVVSSNVSEQDWAGLDGVGVTSFPEGQTFGEWRSYEILPGRHLNMSLCFFAYTVDRSLIHMSRENSTIEAVPDYSLVSNKHNTTAAREMLQHQPGRVLDMTILGVANNSLVPEEPRIPYLEDEGLTWETYTPRLMTILVAYDFQLVIETLNAADLVPHENTTASPCYNLCTDCGGFGIAINPGLGYLTTDTINSTGRAAEALQTIFYLYFSTIYYNYLGSMTIQQEVGLTATVSANVPSVCSETGCLGLIAVSVLMTVHLFYVAAITLLYLRYTKHSRQASLWHTISQLLSVDTEDILADANGLRDTGINSRLKKEKRNDAMRLGRSRAGGRAEIIKIADAT
ncbi:hypothetical protein F5Y16DRAFT_421744 [Xylariaceae sp. FL0255]|nr:hypothetical protein F5Y16DRAFT_421744 [Xylariaceae sp. FL0255]